MIPPGLDPRTFSVQMLVNETLCQLSYGTDDRLVG